MAIYKMILRDTENSDTSQLHVIEHYCEAANRNAAAALFEGRFGVKNVVAGPIKWDTPVPADYTLITA